MIQIVRTPCSRASALADAGMTAMGWAGFVYLIIHDILSASVSAPLAPDAATVQAMLPAARTLLIYLTIAAFNALLLTAWATFWKRPFPDRRATQSDERPRSPATAARFALTGTQLDAMHDSRITVIHHGENGEIRALETGDVQPSRASGARLLCLARRA